MAKHYQIIVVGAGAAGLVVAIGAAKAGKKVLLVEKGTYGGDCTNFGCVPSKSLIASAEAAHAIQEAEDLGLHLGSQQFQAPGVFKRLKSIVEGILSHEDPEALKKHGVETVTGHLTFKAEGKVEVLSELYTADQVVIATGSAPFIPPIDGLENTPFHTNESIFELDKPPQSLIVIGGGPIGCELAQAFQRLGTRVHLIHNKNRLLDREDEKAQGVLMRQFEREGIELHLGAHANQVSYLDGTFTVTLENGEEVQSQALLVAVGRRPNVKGMALETWGIDYDEHGIKTDKYGRTTHKNVWAVGDIAGAPFFTHWAENQARSVLTSLLVPFYKKKVDKAQPIPRVTFTDPEIASIGLSEEEAAKKYSIAVYEVPFSQVDRAITQGREEGFIKIITKKWSSKILGATIVGPRAGEMLGEISLAMKMNIPLRKLASVIYPYPTYNQGIRKAADKWLTETVLPALKGKK